MHVESGFPLLRPERHMIGFESEEVGLQKLRERLRNMTDQELIQFGKSVRKLASPSVAATANPFQRQLEEARAEWKRRKELQMNKPVKEECLDKDRHNSEADA